MIEIDECVFNLFDFSICFRFGFQHIVFCGSKCKYDVRLNSLTDQPTNQSIDRATNNEELTHSSLELLNLCLSMCIGNYLCCSA